MLPVLMAKMEMMVSQDHRGRQDLPGSRDLPVLMAKMELMVSQGLRAHRDRQDLLGTVGSRDLPERMWTQQ